MNTKKGFFAFFFVVFILFFLCSKMYQEMFIKSLCVVLNLMFVWLEGWSWRGIGRMWLLWGILFNFSSNIRVFWSKSRKFRVKMPQKRPVRRKTLICGGNKVNFSRHLRLKLNFTHFRARKASQSRISSYSEQKKQNFDISEQKQLPKVQYFPTLLIKSVTKLSK